jgi:hypothetical protein
LAYLNFKPAQIVTSNKVLKHRKFQGGEMPHLPKMLYTFLKDDCDYLELNYKELLDALAQIYHKYNVLSKNEIFKQEFLNFFDSDYLKYITKQITEFEYLFESAPESRMEDLTTI